jgi:hypothetical protein
MDQMCNTRGAGLCTPDAAIADAPVDARPDAAVIHADAAGLILVQQQAVSGKASMLMMTLATRPTSGHVLVMLGANAAGMLTGVTGGGVTWSKATASLKCANAEIWYGVTNGSNSSVTIKGPSTGDTWMWVGEWSGLDTSNLFDQANSNGTNTTNSVAKPGSITTTSPHELVMLADASQTNSFIAPTPGTWMPLDVAGIQEGFLQNEWFLVTSNGGTFDPSIGPSTVCWDAAIASFRLP